MKIRMQLNRAGNPYWLAEIRLNGRLMLSEGNTYKQALHGAIDLLVTNGENQARRRFINASAKPTQAPAHQGLFLYPEKLHERYHQNLAL